MSYLAYLDIIIEIISKYGLLGSIIIICLLFIIFLLHVLIDEDRSAVWRGRIFNNIYTISGKSDAEKKYIENDVNGRINLARRKMPFGKEHLPKAVKIEWFKGGKGETAHIKENEIVVRLDPAQSQEKNIVLLTAALVEQTSLVGIRHILQEPLEISMDLNLIKNLLKETGNRKVLDWFFRNEYQPNINKSDEIKKWNSKIVEIDERGLFTRLLLVELDDYSKSISGKPFSPEMFKEIAGLVNFLYTIVTKTPGQEVPLEYITRNIKIHIILVAITQKIVLLGIEQYLKAFEYTMKKQPNSIYVLQLDKRLLAMTQPEVYEDFMYLANKLSQEIEKRFKIRGDFVNLPYTLIDPLGNKRKAKISRYIPEYAS